MMRRVVQSSLSDADSAPGGDRHARAGFTVLEAVIALALFTTMLAGMSTLIQTGLGRRKQVESEEARAAYSHRVSRSVRRAVQMIVPTATLPLPLPSGGALAQAPALPLIPCAVLPAGTCELLYQLPADADGDGWPDIDAAGDLVMNPVYHALVLEDGPDPGLYELWHVSEGGARELMARRLIGVQFDDFVTSLSAVPLGFLRVRYELNANQMVQPEIVEFSVRI